MAYDDYLVERVQQYLERKNIDYYNKKMMGGMLFMVDDKMFVGVTKDKKTNVDKLMVRVGADFYEKALEKEHSRMMDFTGGPMKGFVFVQPDGFDLDDDLYFWLDKAMEFNPFAKRSPSKKKKPKK
tara:strand:- start:36 stop:413 length:378 start_codon:yes stop_codon:yes gene_type:complete